jgi:hypothetical protein
VGLRRDSIRPFCSEHLNQTYHIDEINEMNNGNRNPVLENCGGWNCIHEWEPVPDFLL